MDAVLRDRWRSKKLPLRSTFSRGKGDICLGEEVELAAHSSYPYQSFHWVTDIELPCDSCALQTILPVYSGTATAVISDFPGCEIKRSVNYLVDRNCGTFLPNAFSPDGDGNNDVFYVLDSKGGLEILDFKVFNRWGVLVYENPGRCNVIGEPDCGWDGTFGGEQAENGVYVYVVSLRFLGDDRPVTLQGDVLLLR